MDHDIMVALVEMSKHGTSDNYNNYLGTMNALTN